VSRKAIAIAGGAIAVIVILVVALVVAIASSGDEEASPAESSPETFLSPGTEGFERPDPEALEEFQVCLEEQGAELPQPGEEPPTDLEALRKAFAACRDLLPDDFAPSLGGSGGSGPFIFPDG
jgi:hypothetical protein